MRKLERQPLRKLQKEEESALCEKIKEAEHTEGKAAEEAEKLAGQDKVCEKFQEEKESIRRKILTLAEAKKQLEKRRMKCSGSQNG